MQTPTRLLGCLALVFAAAVCAQGETFNRAGASAASLTPMRAQTQTSNVVSTASAYRAILDRYCVTCHNERVRTAGLMLDTIAIEHVSDRADVWEKVVRKLRAGAMPPAGRPRPDKTIYEGFASWLENELDRAATAYPSPGRPPVHRLNRAEYTNAIRDLLALEIDGRSLLPTDESGYGFDNIADVLSISPGLLERYLLAAQKISRLAIGDPSMEPVVETYRLPMVLIQEDRMSDDLPFGSRGGTVIRHHFPLDGEYIVRIRLQRVLNTPVIRGLDNREQLDVRLDGTRLTLFAVGGECVGSKEPRCIRPAGVVPASEYERTADEGLEVRFRAKAGMRRIGLAFRKNTSADTEGAGPARLPGGHSAYAFAQDTLMSVDRVQIEGPFDATGPGDTASRRRIFVCRPGDASERSEPRGAAFAGRKREAGNQLRPASPKLAPEGERRRVQGTPRSIEDEDGCARDILATLAGRAYRRPHTDRDVETLLSFYRTGRSRGSFETGIQLALERLLVSPEFLFRVERDPANAPPGSAYRLSDVELASRLSFFLWSSIPDDELLDVASRGKLRDPTVLEQQVRRLLDDARAGALVTNFGGQWLYLRNMRVVAPDPETFPEFDGNLREAFQRETELFLDSQLREDRSVLELLTANYTFVNERLARFYGIPNVYGTHFRRATYPDDRRAGLLGHGSLLTVTSYSTRTSPVVRGKWLLENFLGAPPPPPPANVPPLKEDGDGAAPTSGRQRLEQHRANPVCASCHAPMDPLGFALENFNGIGKWRTSEARFSIDATGLLPDGTKFDGPAEFRKALLGQRDEFVNTVAEKLLTYALGRGLEYYDMPAIRKITRDAAPSDYRWSSLILGIVKSTPFQMRAAELVH